MPRTRSDASAYSLWGQASLSRGTSFGWVHGDRHEACHPHTSRFFPVLVLRLRRLNYEHPSFFFIRSYLLCLIRPAFGGSARGAHGAEVAIRPRGWIPPFGSRMPPDDLSRSERRARVDEWPTACESVRGHPPPPGLSMRERCRGGSEALGPDLFLTHLLRASRTSRHSSWTSRRLSRSRERPPEPWIQAKTATFDRWAKDLTCWSPSHPPSCGPSSGPIGLCPSRGRTYALAFFPSTPWTDANGSFPPVGRRLGISHSICSIARLSTSLTYVLQRNKFCGAVRVVSRSPYSGQLLPAWGKSVKSCGFGAGWKGLV